MNENAPKNSTSNGLITVLFKNPLDAENAYSELLAEGYNQEDISLIMSDDTRKTYFANEEVAEANFGTKTLEGMGVGGAIGATVGAISAAIAALGTTLVIPSLGIVVSGALAASLAGAGAGATTGGLVGALVGAGLPNEQAREYEAGIQAGGVAMCVNTNSEEDSRLLENKLKSFQQ